MKTVLLLSRLDMTGMTTNTLELYRQLKKIDPETMMLVGRNSADVQNCTRIDELYAKLEADPKVRVVRYRDSRMMHGIELFIRFLWTLATLRPDVVHCESPYYTILPWLLRIPFCVTMHVTDIFPYRCYRKGRAVIAISEETKQWAIDVLGHKESTITLIPHGVSERFSDVISEDFKRRLCQQYHLAPHKLKIGLVGSLEYRKGHDLLLQAFASLPTELKDKAELVFVGSDKDGTHGTWLSNMVQVPFGDLRAHDRVHKPDESLQGHGHFLFAEQTRGISSGGYRSHVERLLLHPQRY